MTDMTQLTGLDTIKNLVRKNGNSIFKPADLEIMERFGALKDDEFMEQTDITRFGKLMETGFLYYKLINPDFKKIRMNVGLFDFQGEKEKSFWFRVLCDETYQYSEWKHRTKTKDDEAGIQMLHEAHDLFQSLVARFKHVRDKQYMRKGVVPKTLQKDKPVEEIIKGKVAEVFVPIIKGAGLAMANREEARIREAIANGERVSGVTHFGDIERPQSVVEKMIQEVRNNVTTVMCTRLASKLGGIKATSVTKSMIAIETTFRFFLSIEFEGNKLYIDGKRIVNVSPKGNYFYQYPMNITVNGKIGERNVKQMLGA